MKKTFKKALSVLLVAVMVFGSAPLAGFVGIELPEFNLFYTKADAETSGYYEYSVIFYDEVSFYGEAIISHVDESISGCITIPSNIDGFTITGINHYAFYGCTGLTSVTIPDSVMRIDDYAFCGCTGLTSITIPDSVTSIGDSAFSNCTSLTSITIPDSVTSIGDYAFSSCTGLPSITIPDSVTSIGDIAFYNCTSLTSITIPDSVTSIGVSAFYQCYNLSTTYYVGTPEQWRDISIGSKNDPINGNIIFECNSERAYYLGTCGENLTWTLYTDGELVIDGTGDMTDYSLSSEAPWYSKSSIIKSVTISDGITSIGNYAFRDYTELTNITIPDSLTSIGSYAFYYCTGLTSVTIPNSVIHIGDCAFYDCTRLISVTIPNSVIHIGDCAFCGCTGLTSVTIPDSVTIIGDSTFSYCTGLTTITIPDSVTSIGNRAFDYCTRLISVTIPDSVTSIGDRAFYNCTSLTSITIPDSVTSIGNSAFCYCTRLISVTIPDSVMNIGYSAFYGCNDLLTTYYTGTPEQWNNISIGFNDGTISKNIVFECNSERPYYDKGICGDNLTWTLYTDGELVIDGTGDMTDYSSSSNAPWYSKRSIIKSVIIDNGVTSIGDCAFYNCTELTGVEISDSVTNIGKDAFYNAGIYNDSSNWENDVLYIGNNLIKAKTTLSSNYTINEETKAIAEYAFFGCSGLTSVTIPDSVTSIGNYAFYNCTNLSTYYTGTLEQWRDISIGSNNYPINRNIIFECNSERPWFDKGICGDNLTWTLYSDGELVIEGTGEMTDYSSYSNVPWYSKRSKIKSVTILDGITSIGNYAFYSCGFTSITIPNGVTSVGDYSFFGCTGLTSLSVSESVTQIGCFAFAGCNNLKKIEFLGYTTSIADDSFQNCPNVVIYCKSGSSIQSFAERNSLMYALTDGEYSDVIIKNNQLVSYQGDSASPKISSGITSIGSNAFKDNSTVKTVELPNSVSSIYSGAFSNCSSLKRIVVPHTVTTIAPDAFSGTNATIVCYANSYAHQYAVEKGMKFELISVTLNQTKVILSVGEYSIITATPEQEYLDSVQTSWKSSDTVVATVDANGKVTARSNGTATIYALAPTGETLATCSVQVGYSFDVTIQNPSTKTISYKSGIILHATAENLPAGAKIVWEKDNDNFSMSDDGNGNCKIVSKANGSTTFTAKVKLADGSIAKDSNGNEISAQVTMNSKAGFFDKIVAFFKGLFGGNKILPQLFKGIF